MEERVRELTKWAEKEGKKLPYPPEVIARIEELGATVDLETGRITLSEDDRKFSATEQAIKILRRLRGEQ